MFQLSIHLKRETLQIVIFGMIQSLVIFFHMSFVHVKRYAVSHTSSLRISVFVLPVMSMYIIIFSIHTEFDSVHFAQTGQLLHQCKETWTGRISETVFFWVIVLHGLGYLY